MLDIREAMRDLLVEEDGIGVIEIVLILVVLIGLVLVFKNRLGTLITNIFNEINSQSEEVYG